MTPTEKKPDCPIEKTLRLIVGKWKTILLWHLSSGTKRYGALKKLIQSLRELEKDALVLRKVYPEVPPRVEYRLSKRGLSLSPLICALNTWGKKHL